MFSSPAPRATPRRRPRGSTSIASRGTPSLYSESEGGAGSLVRSSSLRHLGPHTPSVRSSRLSILRRPAASPASSAGETIRSARQDGMDGIRNIYARDERICVSNIGGLPKEVQSYVKRADYSSRPVEGHVDPLSGYAFICSYEGCTAWNYQKRTHSSSTCYTFPAPQPVYGQSGSPVKAAIYVPSSSAEPGLLMVNESGEIRFWENMSLALAKIDRCQALRLDVGPNEAVERIVRVAGNVFVLTTTSSSVFRLSVLSQSGRASLHPAPLTRPGGMFGRASPQIFTKSEDREGLKAVTCVDGFTYLLGSGGTLQKWSVTQDGHRFAREYNLPEVLGSALAEQDWVSAGSTVLIEDIEAASANQLAVLVSTIEQQSTSSFQSSGSSAIVIFNLDRSHGLTPATAIAISYTSSSSDGSRPSLHIPFGSHLTFIKYPDSVVIASLTANEDYENVLSLKDTNRNAFIGIGSKDFPVDATRRSIGSPLVMMPITGGLMGVEIYDGPMEKPTDMTASTAAMKSKIEQAVFYGDRSENPLSFDLSTEIRGNIGQAVEAVSQEILDSSSPHMPPSFELKAHLLDRLTRHVELITFIRGNGQLSELSQATRRRLMRDAEKAKAAIELWEYQNKLMEHVHAHSPHSQLADAITAFMDEIGVMGEGDLVRTFFRVQVSRLDRILEIVLQNLRATVAHVRDPLERTALVLEANKIVILVIRVASTFREEQGAAYEADVLRPEIDLWTAKDSLIDGLDFLYSSTEQLIKDRTRTLGSVIDESAIGESRDAELKLQRQKQAVLKDQLTQLAAALCAQMEDRLRRVERQMSEGADPQDGLALQKRYDALKPRVIRPLVAIDKIAQAYELAEHHTDFPTLVWLCHEPASASGPTRVQTYTERHGEEFAFVLYQWYIDQGRLHDLMSQDPVYGSLLTKFFESGEHPELAWMHHLACGRYADAAEDLMVVNKVEDVLVQKHLISSIAKLTAVVDIKRNGANDRSKPTLSNIDQELELVQLENELREAILSNLPDRRHTKQAIKTYIDTQTASLEDRPAFQSLLGQLIARLLDGEALDIENLIDVLTLNNDPARTGDRALALDRLSRDDSLPESRGQVALLSIWRRVFIQDDWELISKTAGRSEEAQRRLQRSTSTYHTIKAVNSKLDFPPAYILAPYTCTQSPTTEEISARFLDWPAPHIDALRADHESEINLIERYIEECELEQRVKEIAELVRRDADEEEAEAETEDDGDVSM